MKLQDLLKNKKSIISTLGQKLIDEKVEIDNMHSIAEGVTIEVQDRKISLVRLFIEEQEQIILRLEGDPIQFYSPESKSLVFFPHKVEISTAEKLIEGFFFLLTCDEAPDLVLPV